MISNDEMHIRERNLLSYMKFSRHFNFVKLEWEYFATLYFRKFFVTIVKSWSVNFRELIQKIGI